MNKNITNTLKQDEIQVMQTVDKQPQCGHCRGSAGNWIVEVTQAS